MTASRLNAILRSLGAPAGPEPVQAAGSGPSEGELISTFTHSELRWTYDIMINEFVALRAEIVAVKQQVERTYTYLFALIGAIAASRLLSSGTLATIDRHRIVFLIAALLVLWFPVNHLLMSGDMILAGAYIRDVIAPKLNDIAHTMAHGCDGVAHAGPDADLVGWSIPELPDIAISDHLRNPMAWEEFMAYMRLRATPRRYIFGPLYVARALLLYVPTALLVALYVSAARRHGLQAAVLVNAGSIALLAALLILVGLSVAAQINTSHLLSQGTHVNPHGSDLGSVPTRTVPG